MKQLGYSTAGSGQQNRRSVQCTILASISVWDCCLRPRMSSVKLLQASSSFPSPPHSQPGQPSAGDSGQPLTAARAGLAVAVALDALVVAVPVVAARRSVATVKAAALPLASLLFQLHDTLWNGLEGRLSPRDSRSHPGKSVKVSQVECRWYLWCS